jgi:hypothetical protein
VDASPWAKHIRVALRKAHTACSTEQIAKIAIELYKRIREDEKSKDSPPTEPPTGDGDSPPTEPPTEPPDDVGDGDGDGDGDETEPPTDGDKGDGDKPVEDGDDPVKKGHKKSDPTFDGGRDPEPSKFIEDALSDVTALADKRIERPTYGKPKIATFTWE